MLRTIFVVISLVLLSPSVSWGGRALRIQSAETLSPRRGVFETGLHYNVFTRTNGNVTSIVSPNTYRYGITRNWESGFTIPIVNYEQGPKKLGDMVIETRYRFRDGYFRRAGSIAVQAKLYFPTHKNRSREEGVFSPIDVKLFRLKTNMLFTQNYGSWKLNENIGYTIVSNSGRVETDNIITGGISLEKQLSSVFTLVSELEVRNRNLPGYVDSKATLFSGVVYKMNSGWEVDFGAGIGGGGGSIDLRSSVGMRYLF